MEGRTGIAKHASTAAFTTARAVTSHVRRRYHTHYHGKYRFASVVFGFDLMLLGLAALFVGLNVYLFMVLPAPRDAFRLDFVSADLRAAAPVALEARVTAIGEGPHEDVRLFWDLPEGTRVLESNPPIDTDGGVYFGSFPVGFTSTSRLVVRMLTAEPVVSFSFRVEDRETRVSGVATRRVTGSGLVFEPVIPVGSVVQNADVLYKLSNETNLPLENVRVGSVTIGRLEPYEERLMPFSPTTLGAVRVQASVEGVLVVDRVETYALLVSDPTGVRLVLSPSDGRELSLVAEAGRPALLAIYHTGLPDAGHMRILEIPAGRSDIRLPVSSVTAATTWYAFPFQRRSDGNALGSVMSASISTPFTVHAAARYYAASGDQIGVGPLPPRVGETTKLWIGLRIDPTTSDLSDVRVRVKLASGVRVTGRDALPDGGSFTQTDTELIWNLGILPADADGASASFEIQFTPNESQKGSVPILIESVTAEGTDMRAGERRAQSGVVDMSLPEDEIGKNRGTVE